MIFPFPKPIKILIIQLKNTTLINIHRRLYFWYPIPHLIEITLKHWLLLFNYGFV